MISPETINDIKSASDRLEVLAKTCIGFYKKHNRLYAEYQKASASYHELCDKKNC